MQNTHLEKDVAGAGDDLYLIPFQLGSELVLKSILNPTLKARTTIYGAVLDQMIIIEEPLFPLNERFAGLSEEFLCAYLHGDQLFKFKSKFIRHLFSNVIGIDYPDEVDRIQVRSSTRIPVDIETEVHVETQDGTISGRIAHISEGGCRLELRKLIQTQKGSKVHLRFTLPDNQSIDNLVCIVKHVKHLDGNTIGGVSFSGPAQAIIEIKKFCRLYATLLALEARGDNFF
jgi:c-di-GMP-binding flagellar brake protein YcgR